MKITLTLLDDAGTFEISRTSNVGDLRMSNHAPDPNNPLIYRPKFEPCKHRVNKCRMSECGKRAIFQWHCQLFDKLIGYKDCVVCDAEKS